MKDGGSAFPHKEPAPGGHGVMECHQGMTLRDWFAGQALIAWRWRVHGDIGSPEQIAKLCYAQADAMLKARGEV